MLNFIKSRQQVERHGWVLYGKKTWCFCFLRYGRNDEIYRIIILRVSGSILKG